MLGLFGPSHITAEYDSAGRAEPIEGSGSESAGKTESDEGSQSASYAAAAQLLLDCATTVPGGEIQQDSVSPAASEGDDHHVYLLQKL